MSEEPPDLAGSRSPRTREASTFSLLASERDIQNQLKEDLNEAEESDPSIVVRDGKTDHMAKGWAVIQCKHSTDVRERIAPMKRISSTLLALNRKAKVDKKFRFKSLYRLIVKQMLYDCFYRLKKNAATGVDGVTFVEKSSLVRFQHWRSNDSGKFTFFGFDFYWAKTRRNKNHRVVKRKTNKKKFQQSLQKLKDWIKASRSWPLKMILSSLRKRLRGDWNYYCVIGNGWMTGRYLSAVKRLIYKWLNRRSQRKSFGWTRFAKLWHEHWRMPEPRIIEQGRPLYGTDAEGNLIPSLFD